MINKIPQIKLYAPKEYWAADKEQLSKITNGCGTDGWKGKLVPETLWGLNISVACNIHDWMYHYGQTHEDKEASDRIFLNNMVRIINSETDNWLLRKLRLRRARTYYEAVSFFGGEAFWQDKNPSGTFELLEKSPFQQSN